VSHATSVPSPDPDDPITRFSEIRRVPGRGQVRGLIARAYRESAVVTRLPESGHLWTCSQSL